MEVEDEKEISSLEDDELVIFMGERHVLMGSLLQPLELLL